ncbi:MAG: DUF1080 domain-containing protein [Planctomycetaceae bacterium]|nr:DUF1080 domain-containing protein [Planctomycetaceae bacterium]
MHRTAFAGLALLLLCGCGGTDPAPESKGTGTSGAAASPDESEAAEKKSSPRSGQAGSTAKPIPAAAAGIDVPEAEPPTLFTAEQLAEGWVALFDGQTLFGWEASHPKTGWRVEDGTIIADGTEPGLLLTSFEIGDFDLSCECQLEAGGNSGVFLHTTRNPSDPSADCWEFNLCDTHEKFPTGSMVARKAVPLDHPIEDGKWHSMLLKAMGNRLVAFIDGEQVLEYEDDTATPRTTGFIGLQMNGGKVKFRNVYLRPTGTKPLFNGTDLAGWRVVPGSNSEFEVNDGAIHIGNGPGFLETTDTYGDFVLQLEARTNAERINSGVFFRAQPGTEENPSNGYELQIHHGFAEGDRRRPDDYGTGFGTGAIFRRVPVRRVMANDNEWFHMTLLAQGPHFVTWVNGYRTVDFIDTRPADENPRRGLRLEAGHLSLQGHDPGTDIDFRNLEITTIAGGTAAAGTE